MSEFLKRKEFSNIAITVLQHLPLWEDSTSFISTVRALFLPSSDWVFPEFPVTHTIVSDKIPDHTFIRYIEGSLLTSSEYVWSYVVRNLPNIVSQTQLGSIRKLHDFILANRSSWNTSYTAGLAHAALVPDATRKLRPRSNCIVLLENPSLLRRLTQIHPRFLTRRSIWFNRSL